jgi:hypothetical protein
MIDACGCIARLRTGIRAPRQSPGRLEKPCTRIPVANWTAPGLRTQNAERTPEWFPRLNARNDSNTKAHRKLSSFQSVSSSRKLLAGNTFKATNT